MRRARPGFAVSFPHRVDEQAWVDAVVATRGKTTEILETWRDNGALEGLEPGPAEESSE